MKTLSSKEQRDKVQALIAQVALGDHSAFAQLYDATAGKLLAVCMPVLNERAAAEDALQETYIKIWKNANLYQVTGHSPMTWLITIARNTAIDRLRTRTGDRDVADYDDRIASPGPSPEQSAIAASDSKQVVQCLDQLEASRRTAITGAYLYGKSYQDLSDELDVPLNTIRTWLRRGLIALRECMSQ
ncbi:MAG: sigma-70 family RNA polymerase sigma factor [Sulfitobacter sp.]